MISLMITVIKTFVISAKHEQNFICTVFVFLLKLNLSSQLFKHSIVFFNKFVHVGTNRKEHFIFIPEKKKKTIT